MTATILQARYAVVLVAALGALGCEATSRSAAARQSRSTAERPTAEPAAAPRQGAPTAPVATPPAPVPAARPGAGATARPTPPDVYPEPPDSSATSAPAPPTPPAVPSAAGPARTGSCHAELACSSLGSARGGKATLSVRLSAGKVVSLEYVSECSPPVTYSGRRDGLALEAASDDWLVVGLSVSGVWPGRTPEEGYQPSSHEESRAFRIRQNDLEWAEPANHIATTGKCLWQ